MIEKIFFKRNIEKKKIQKNGNKIFLYFWVKPSKLFNTGNSESLSGEKITVTNGITEAIPIISTMDNNKNKNIIKKNFF